MIVLHAIWDNAAAGILHLWGESSELATVPARESGEMSGREHDKFHPFSLSHATLLDELARLPRLPGHDALLEVKADTLALRLPTSASRPLPSPQLLLDESFRPSTKKTLKWWHIETCSLPARAALDFLLELPIEPPQSIAFGAALRFWIEAARLAFELIARQCFVPTINVDQQGTTYTGYARWAALLAPEDSERVHVLARAMPPVCWASMPSGSKDASVLQDIVGHFLNQTIDGFVRAQIATSALVPKGRRASQDGSENFSERWMRALASPIAVFTLPPTTKAVVATAQKWLEQVQVEATRAPFRTCFKLDPPGEEQAEADAWRVSFHLQANDDHSLLIPAEKAWQERSEVLTFLSRKFDHPQERLLTDLGKASRIFPLLEESLKSARPQEVLLNTEQAYMFLRETAPLLECSGFGVLIPPWWQKASARIGVKLKLKPKSEPKSSLGMLGFDKIVEYDWNIAVGDKTLSIREFEQLVDLKLPLVKVRGQWVELRPDQIEAAIAFFKKKYTKQTLSLAEALRDTLGENINVAGLPITEIESEGWVKDALDKLAQRVPLTTIEPPATFQGKLRPYQLRGVSWLAFLKQLGFGGCLADDMGLGKCVAACANILVNGTPLRAEELWQRYASDISFDGEGYWTTPSKQLWTYAVDEKTGQLVQAPIRHLYRQYVSTHVRQIYLENGSCVTITYPHKLLTAKGWSNALHIGDYVATATSGQQEVHYCPIRQIEDVAYNGWVYDLEVEQYHNFVADTILCHNTIQLITLLLYEIAQRPAAVHARPTLLICPMSIVGNWQRELQRFAPSLSVMIHHGLERLSDESFAAAAREHDVVITTYAMALRDKEHLALVDWHNIVIDEAQNIKNESAKQTQAIKSLKAVSKIALTGTPVENRLAELWSIMDFLNPGYLGSGTEFRKSFANPIERYRDVKQSATLKRLIQPFVLRRLKTDKEIIQDLPDKMEMSVFCNLTQEQASLYEAVLKEMLEKIEQTDGIARRGLILATLTKLKQICNHPAQFMSDGSQLSRRSGKLARLEEMLEEVLAGGDKALIFTQYAEMGALLRQYLQETLGVEVLFLYGGTPKKQRDILVQRFQEERQGAALFILSLKAGGVGLNLTAANHVFHFDRWWNPAVENQATDRAFRIGQHKNVQVHKFVCVGTLEERIDQMIEQKRDLAERIVGEGENWLTEMSTDQLKELFALSREAVGE
ncbi:MAG: hypothetical protein NVS2B12_03680 [Ktedonobacteraceae bacterium]